VHPQVHRPYSELVRARISSAAERGPMAAKLPKSTVFLLPVNFYPILSNLPSAKPNVHLSKEKLLLNKVDTDCLKTKRASNKVKFHLRRPNVSALKMNVCLNRIDVDWFTMNVDPFP
jgi:hypothetical protein